MTERRQDRPHPHEFKRMKTIYLTNSRHVFGGGAGPDARDSQGSLRRFLAFLTNDVFVPSLPPSTTTIAAAAGAVASGFGSIRQGSLLLPGGAEPPSLLAAAAGMPGAPSLSLSFLAPTRTDALATAAATAAPPLPRRASGMGVGSLLSSQGGGGLMVAGGVGGGGQRPAAAVDVFMPPPLEGAGGAGAAYVPNGGMGASLGPAAVAAQARTVAEARRKGRERAGWW